MRIINLIKSEFIKNYNLKKIFNISLIILIVTVLFVEVYSKIYNKDIITGYYSDYLINELEKKEKLTNEEEFNLYFENEKSYYYDYLNSLKASFGDYREDLIDRLLESKQTNKAIEIYRKNKDSEEIKYICSSNKEYYESVYEGTINHICDIKDDIDKIYEENKQVINDYDTLIKENKYYKYVEYQLNKGLIYKDNIPLARIVINEKIEEPKHYLSINYRNYSALDDKYEPESKENFNSYESEYASYYDYLRFKKILTNDAKKMKKIIEYSSNEKIINDLSFTRYDSVYNEDNVINTKNQVNFIFHYSIFVMIIVSITSGGIVAKEHSGGTIKKIITAPVKRWKILLSKFIYLILHTYIIWIIALIILSLYSGIKYGFSDLLSPKLIYFNGKVVEVNYYLNLLKDLFIASIPVICFLSILLFLSTVTLNTSVTTGICSLISILSIISWYIVSQFKVLIATPLMYFDMGFIYTRSDTYMEALTQCNISYSYGIIISLLLAALLFVITNIIYNKRDIIS